MTKGQKNLKFERYERCEGFYLKLKQGGFVCLGVVLGHVDGGGGGTMVSFHLIGANTKKKCASKTA